MSLSNNEEFRALLYLRRGILDLVVITLIELLSILLIFVMEYLRLTIALQNFFITLPASVASVLLLFIAYSDVKRGYFYSEKVGIRIKTSNIVSPLLLLLFLLSLIGLSSYILTLVGLFTSISNAILNSAETLLRLFAFVTFVFLGFSYKIVGDHYKNDYISIGSLAFILGVVVFIFNYRYGGLLAFISIITIYVGFSNILGGLTKPSTINGVLRSNGEAEVLVYSESEAQITNAYIVGTQYVSNSITPTILNKGYTTLKINFNTTLPLNVNNNYIIRLILANGKNIDVNVIFQQ
ncbi:DUF973 family protein [Sulfolobus tengchongensis]|uniref:DUF973 family protein n=1 Tax=Sulfolobus tengchongensis TaxID=207809 RepID=A0AAX4KYL4_9CREN